MEGVQGRSSRLMSFLYPMTHAAKGGLTLGAAHRSSVNE